jgi:hypothetical protein
MFNRDANKIYITLLILLLIMSLGVLLPYFYIRIFAQIVKKRKNLMKKNRSENPEKFKYRFKKTKGIFYSFLLNKILFILLQFDSDERLSKLCSTLCLFVFILVCKSQLHIQSHYLLHNQYDV